MKFKVTYVGWYFIEAESVEEALESNRDDSIDYEEWENVGAICVEDAE